MQNIILKPLLHRNSEYIGIYFDKNIALEKIIRRQPAVKWSQTKKCWYVPLSETAYKKLTADLKEKAAFNNAALKTYLEKKKNIQALLPEKKQPIVNTKTSLSKPVALTQVWQLDTDNLKALENFVQQLQLKAYSPSTINTYRNEFMQLLKILNHKPVDELTTDELKRYMVYAMEKAGFATAMQFS